MTRFSDNLYSGKDGLTLAKASRAPVSLTREFHVVGASAASLTQNAVLPSYACNLTGTLYIANKGSATSSDAVTVSANGVNIFTFSSFGSSQGIVFNQTVAGLATFTAVVSAMINTNNPPTTVSGFTGGELPISVTWAFSSASRTKQTDYKLVIEFNRYDDGSMIQNYP